jgi:hypothetical protein
VILVVADGGSTGCNASRSVASAGLGLSAALPRSSAAKTFWQVITLATPQINYLPGLLAINSAVDWVKTNTSGSTTPFHQ